MTDRELLELAAKVAEIEYDGIAAKDIYSGHYVIPWNPLTDDGDALRLAVKLNVPLDGFTIAPSEWMNDPYAATRRAIVRAAAEIGKGMK
jgi:hypothetical protein